MKKTFNYEMVNAVGIKPLIILTGNTADLIPFEAHNGAPNTFEPRFMKITAWVRSHFMGDYKDVDFLVLDPVLGFQNEFRDGNNLVATVKNAALAKRREQATFNNVQEDPKKPLTFSEIIRAAMAVSGSKPVVVIVKNAGRMISGQQSIQPNEQAALLNLMCGAENAVKVNGHINSVVFVTEKSSDFPRWFTEKPFVKEVHIPLPDIETREAFARMLPKLRGNQTFVSNTESLTCSDLCSIELLYSKKTDEDVAGLIRSYRFGFNNDMWINARKHLLEIEKNEGVKVNLRKCVKGQNQAIDKIYTTIAKAVVGGASKGPRGVLFFAGPTGTGKTELVKSIGRMLSVEEDIQRFDMSEYSESHQAARLYGAPPGYVGYDAGGQLTEAVLAKPFSILLFDEIEKAHPSILDKFLQVLEDGRMTSGDGKIVDFSNTLVIFTSNIGSERIKSGMTNTEIKSVVTESMKAKMRPEFINRIGLDNIIAFNMISKEVVKDIVNKFAAELSTEKRAFGIRLSIDAQVVDYIDKICSSDPSVMGYGGRAIKHCFEQLVSEPLAVWQFVNEIFNDAAISVKYRDGKIVFEKM